MKKHWTITALALAVLVIFFTAACSKTKISSEPVAMPTAEEEAARKAEEEARQRELERQKALAEENLKEEGLTLDKKEDEKIIFENEDIYFEFDSVQLTPEAQEILTKKGSWLRDNPTATVTIEGHCDNRGTNEYNLALGEGRAQSAKTFLMDLGIEDSKLNTISYGEERPIDPRQTEGAWAKNRRAHFVIDE